MLRQSLILGLGLLLAASRSTAGEIDPGDWDRIREAHDRACHAFRKVPGGWRADSPGQRWATHFDEAGFLVRPEGADWRWGLQLTRYGFEGSERIPAGRAVAEVDSGQLRFRHDESLIEWFLNDRRGLEHGFILEQRPEGRGELLFALDARGTLRPVVSSDLVVFEDASGAPVLTYSGLKVWDADGRILACRFEASGGTEFEIRVDDRDARYPLTIDPLAQQAFLKPEAVGTSQAGDNFGWSAAISGDTVVVGAPLEDSSSTGVNSTPDDVGGTGFNSGAAYVFVRNGETWSQQAYLKPDQVGASQEGDEFGISVAISGDTVVVGAWQEAGGSTGVDGSPQEPADEFYTSGAAYVFVRDGDTWSQQAYLKAFNIGAANRGDSFGQSVGISGDRIVVGAGGEDGSSTGVDSAANEGADRAGAAYVFRRSGVTWSEEAYLKPSGVGSSQVLDRFGSAVAISGDVIAVGAYGENSSSTGVDSTPNEDHQGISTPGAAYVFERGAGGWMQEAYLKPAAVGSSQVGDNFGYSVAVSGATVVVGARREDSNSTGVNSVPEDSGGAFFDAGAAYVFVRGQAGWEQQAYLKPAVVGDSQGGDNLGVSVAIDGDVAVVGATRERSGSTGINSTPDETSSTAGAAYVFVRSGSEWTQQAYLKPAATGGSLSTDNFGSAVAVSGGTVVVGSFGERSGSTGVGAVPDESAVGAGAGYVFTGFAVAVADYAAWSAGNIPPGEDASFEGDWNRDGVPNGVEYVFGDAAIDPSLPVPPGVPADVEIHLDRSFALGPPTWTTIASWIDGAPVFLAEEILVEDGLVVDGSSEPRAFYRYRVLLR